tara:strand:- start:881 stop:1687 length:807 start_codon:yes stop_codon:yes gene_type:complete
MIHIITNHHETSKWVNLQAQYLENNTSEPYKVYCGVTDMVFPLEDRIAKNYNFYDLKVPNVHADKLNALYRIQSELNTCNDDDLLVFLDPDALLFLNNWDQKLRTYLKAFPVVAISREENIEPLLKEDQKPYPHPCFLVTTVKFWRDHNLSWDLDPSQGAECAGVLLKKFLDINGIKWKRLLRTNAYNLHPLNFGIYDDMIYHHGSGNRPVYDSIDIWGRKELSEAYGVGLDLHWPELLEFNSSLSVLVFNHLEKDERFIRRYFLGKK